MALNCSSLIFVISTLLMINSSVQENNTKKTLVYSGCSEVTSKSMPSGIYAININNYHYRSEIKVSCDTKTWGGHWTIILQRMDGSVNFYRSWDIYKEGFGDLDGDFFLGLDNIYALTAKESQELLILLEDSDGNEAYERYEKFAISSRHENYALNTLGRANGTAGDSLSHHYTYSWSTFDRNNVKDSVKNCAEKYTGAWWYTNQCHTSNLAGKYGENTFGQGINWITFRGFENSMKRAVMMIRPRNL